MDSTSSPELLCDVVIPIWNQQERTKACLESILRCGRQGLRLVLVDNGSDTPTREFLERFRAGSSVPVELIRNPANLGFIKAVNQGILAGISPWVCILNNDTIVTDGWAEEMIRVAESSPRIGLVNPTSNSLGFHAGSVTLEAYARGLRSQTGKWTELSTALGFCLLARRSLLQKVGLLDERYGMGNFDDDDLSRRVKGIGLLCVRACGAYVYHEEKVSFRELAGWEAEFDKNRQRFEERWGRPLRILWVVPPQGLGDAQVPLDLARDGHWVTLVVGRGEIPASVLSHSQVACIEAKRAGRAGKALWRLLTKRKKPFDLVISDDPSCGRWARLLSPFHRAQVLIRPEPKEVSKACQDLSRSRS